MGRQFPNVLVTGTPGTGKTTFCELLVEMFPPPHSESKEDNDSMHQRQQLGFVHLKVGDIVKDQQLYTEWDDNLNVPIFDDDLVLNYLQTIMEEDRGGKLVDFHSGEFFPSEWFDLVIVLRADSHILYDRLEQRGYSKAKITENVEAEIFQTILEEIQNEFGEKIEIWVMPSNTIDEQNQILERIKNTIQPILEHSE